MEASVELAIAQLKGMKAKTSIRTGFHVHMDVTDLESCELEAFVCIYLLLEDAIFQYAGPNREALLFCQRLTHVPYMLSRLRKMGKCDSKLEFLDALPTQDMRYCGLNLHSVAVLGTVEFRHLPMMMDENYILDFIEVMLLMKLECYGKTGMQVVEEFTVDPSGWYARVLKDRVGFVGKSSYHEGVCLASCLVANGPTNPVVLDDNWFPKVSDNVTRWLASPKREV